MGRPARTRTSEDVPTRTGWSSRIVTSVLATTAFNDLGISASIWSGGFWRAIHLVPGMGEFEAEYGKELLRWAYNDRCLTQARAQGRMVRGEHGGFHDLFVPIESGAPTTSVLVAGPFAVEEPTGPEVIARWYELTHARANVADPAFSRYLSQTLGTLTLQGPLRAAFERWMVCLARLLGGAGDPEPWAREADALTRQLLQARATERMWEAARSMIDERTTHLWSTPLKRDPLRDLGMDRPPLHAVVGLVRNRLKDFEPVDEALRCRSFQRAAADLAWKRANVVCGQMGDRGISLFVSSPRTAARVRPSLLDLTAKVADVARRFGFRMHAGIAPAEKRQSLTTRHREALAAAERALSRGTAVAFVEGRPDPTMRSLAHLRARLAQSLEGRPHVLLARFERYVEGVVVHTGYEVGATRAHLEAGLERLAEPLLSSGQLDQRSFDELRVSVEQRGGDTVAALVDAYRGVVVDIERALHSPTAARQDRSTRRALRFIREHLGEPLTLLQVSRIAGFAPGYFSKLLRREVGATFDRHLQRLRLERAKQALAGTSLSVERVAQLSGFRSRTYFQQLFREQTGSTPIVYRRRQAPD